MTYQLWLGDALFWDSSEDSDKSAVVNIRLEMDMDRAGTLSFTVLPTHPMAGQIQRGKSLFTVKRDGAELFRGRVTTDRVDIYRQRAISCEGDRAFLSDSIRRPFTFEGTAGSFFTTLIENHNQQVDEGRRFAVGVVTAARAGETVKLDEQGYQSTKSLVEEKLLGVFGGYIRTRTEGQTHYIDWVQDYGEDRGSVALGVNMLTLDAKAGMDDVFTVLIPLGAAVMGEDGVRGDPLTISSVNSGLDYIEDAAGVAAFGRIWRTNTWNEDDPSALLQKGREYLTTGAQAQSILCKAVDMRFISGSAEAIGLGDRVNVTAAPHGISGRKKCVAMTLRLQDIEQSEYTFGRKLRTLSDNTIAAEKEAKRARGGGGGKRTIEEQIGDLKRYADVNFDASKATAHMIAGELDTQKNLLSEAGVFVAGSNPPSVNIMARQSSLNELGERVTTSEASIDVMSNAISLRASEINELTGRITSAEIDIDGANGEINLCVRKNGVISAIRQTSESVKIQASKIELDGYVTASQLSSSLANMENGFADYMGTNTLRAIDVTIVSKLTVPSAGLKVGIHDMSAKSLTVVKDVSISVSRGGNGYVMDVTLTKTTETLKYLGY